MLKKWTIFALTAALVMTFALNTYAYPDNAVPGTPNTTVNNSASGETSQDSTAQPSSDGEIKALIKAEDTPATEQFLVTITRPDVTEETTYKKSYVICGITEEADVTVSLARFNKDAGEFEDFQNTDGVSSWDVGSFGLFAKEVILSQGENKIKLVAYKKSQKDNLEQEDIQVNYFTVTLLDESIKDKILKGVKKIKDIFDPIFK